MTYKRQCVVHLDAESKALADLAAARACMPTKTWLSQLIIASIPVDCKEKHATKGATKQ